MHKVGTKKGNIETYIDRYTDIERKMEWIDRVSDDEREIYGVCVYFM